MFHCTGLFLTHKSVAKGLIKYSKKTKTHCCISCPTFDYSNCSLYLNDDSFRMVFSALNNAATRLHCRDLCPPQSCSHRQLFMRLRHLQSARRYRSIIRPGGAASSCLSHHLSPRHGVLLVRRVPVSKIVHVRSRVHRCPFGGHADVPQGAGRGRGGRRRGKVLPFRSTGPVLHYLLVFGPLVLEPYLHLKIEEEERKGVKSGHIPTQVPATEESYWTRCRTL